MARSHLRRSPSDTVHVVCSLASIYANFLLTLAVDLQIEGIVPRDEQTEEVVVRDQAPQSSPRLASPVSLEERAIKDLSRMEALERLRPSWREPQRETNRAQRTINKERSTVKQKGGMIKTERDTIKAEPGIIKTEQGMIKKEKRDHDAFEDDVTVAGESKHKKRSHTPRDSGIEMIDLTDD
jgi:hypothetical protein